MYIGLTSGLYRRYTSRAGIFRIWGLGFGNLGSRAEGLGFMTGRRGAQGVRCNL